jgi:hypothetical protein
MPLVARSAVVVVAVALLAAAAVAGGCSSGSKDPFDDWAAGYKYENFVPVTAQPVAHGQGVLTYKAPENGTLYVLDTSKTVDIEGHTKPTVVISGYLPAGTEVIFDPADKRVRAKGREGLRLTQVDPTHSHELRFDPSVKRKPQSI